MFCPSCYSSHLRLSKFRSEDVGHLLVLQYPLRCRTCGERSYGNVFHVMTLRRVPPIAKKDVGEAKGGVDLPT